jgi:hypothetical protein
MNIQYPTLNNQYPRGKKFKEYKEKGICFQQRKGRRNEHRTLNIQCSMKDTPPTLAREVTSPNLGEEYLLSIGVSNFGGISATLTFPF